MRAVYLALVVACAASTSHAADDTRPPNVLLVITDDQGWGDLSCHGNPVLETPILDRFAAQSVELDRFFVSPVCAPTRASLLTGRYHLRTGVYGVTRGYETMRAEEVTLAEVLREHGYATGCFGKWHNGAHYPEHPLGQGFDEFFGFCGGHFNEYFDPVLQRNGRPVRCEGYITDVLTDAALQFIEAHRHEPFFCYVPYNAPHSPVQVPDHYFDKYKAQGLDDFNAGIYGMCKNIDDNFALLLDRLDELELADDTIVIFMTDNGPNGNRYNGEMRGAKGSVHEGGVRVPCFIRWPGQLPPHKVEHITAHIDMLPTLAELCGASLSGTPELDGVSIARLLRNEPVSWPGRMIFTNNSSRDGDVPGRIAVRTPRWRLANDGKQGGWTLYNLLDDPSQRTNLADAKPQLTQRLIAACERWKKDVTQQPPGRPIISVGYEQWPRVELPAPEAYFDGDIRYYNDAGYAHDWLTGWDSTEETIGWDIAVVSPGRYEATLLMACPPAAAGSKLRLEIGDQSVEAVVPKMQHYRPPQTRPDRADNARQTLEFHPVKLGTLELGSSLTEQERIRITLRALEVPGDTVGDVDRLVLQRVADSQ